MSVERVERKDGSVVWRVRWRQGGRNRSKVLGRKRDAEAFDAELVRKKRTGELAQLDAGKELLSDFGEEWWRLYAEPNLDAPGVRHAVGRARAPAARRGAAARVDAGGHQPLPARARGAKDPVIASLTRQGQSGQPRPGPATPGETIANEKRGERHRPRAASGHDGNPVPRPLLLARNGCEFGQVTRPAFGFACGCPRQRRRRRSPPVHRTRPDLGLLGRRRASATAPRDR
jgi:hypothetical protein